MMKWKVCGMKYADNIRQVARLAPDYMGFIFYAGSPRFVGSQWEGPGHSFPTNIKKVGVFVNESQQQVKFMAARYGLDMLQLHGEESPNYCQQLSQQGYSLIKAVAIRDESDLSKLDLYKPWVKYFLFDTPGQQYGGTGRTFNWSLLQHYDRQIPFILSGGISLEALDSLETLQQDNLAFIDVNSKFEERPGLKNIQLLAALKKKITAL